MEKQLEELKLSQKLNGYLLEKLMLSRDGSLPNRDIHLQLIEILISMTERELESFHKSTASTQLQPSEPSVEQLVNGVTDVAEKEEEDDFDLIIPSYLFEEPDDSLDLELILSHFFDEENDADIVDSKLLILSDGVNNQPQEVLSDEVSGEKHLRLQVILPTTQTKSISASFIIIMNSSRELFDRGRDFEIRKGFSDIGNYTYFTISKKPGHLVRGVCSIQVDKFDWKYIYEDSIRILSVKNENRHIAGKLFDKTPERAVWNLNGVGDGFLLQPQLGKVSFQLINYVGVLPITVAARRSFDRGKFFTGIKRYSYHISSSGFGILLYCMIISNGLILMGKSEEIVSDEGVLKIGYHLKWFSADSIMLIKVENSGSHNGRKVFEKMSQIGTITRSISSVLSVGLASIEMPQSVLGTLVKYSYFVQQKYELIVTATSHLSLVLIFLNQWGGCEAANKQIRVAEALELQFSGLVLFPSTDGVVLQILDMLMLEDHLRWKFKVFLIDLLGIGEGVSSKWFISVLFRLPTLTTCRKSDQCGCSYCCEAFIFRFKSIHQPPLNTLILLLIVLVFYRYPKGDFMGFSDSPVTVILTLVRSCVGQLRICCFLQALFGRNSKSFMGCLCDGGICFHILFASTCFVFDPGKQIGQSVYELVSEVLYDDFLLVPVGIHVHKNVSQFHLLRLQYLFMFHLPVLILVRPIVYLWRWVYPSPLPNFYIVNPAHVQQQRVKVILYACWIIFPISLYFPACCCRLLWVSSDTTYLDRRTSIQIESAVVHFTPVLCWWTLLWMWKFKSKGTAHPEGVLIGTHSQTEIFNGSTPRPLVAKLFASSFFILVTVYIKVLVQFKDMSSISEVLLPRSNNIWHTTEGVYADNSSQCWVRWYSYMWGLACQTKKTYQCVGYALTTMVGTRSILTMLHIPQILRMLTLLKWKFRLVSAYLWSIKKLHITFWHFNEPPGAHGDIGGHRLLFDRGKMHELFSWNSHLSRYGSVLVYKCTKANGYELFCRWACKVKQLESNFDQIVMVSIEVLLQSNRDINLIENPSTNQPQGSLLYGLSSTGRTLCTQHIIFLLVRIFGVVAVHKYSGGILSDIKLRLRALYMENPISITQVNDKFTENGGGFSVGSWHGIVTISTTVMHYKLINYTLDNVFRCLPCCSQLLGFLLRHKWRSKGVLIFETEVETTSTSTRAVGEVLDAYFQLQQYTQVHSSHNHTSTTKSTTNIRNGLAKVGGRTCMQLQLYMRIRLEPTWIHQFALIRVISGIGSIATSAGYKAKHLLYFKIQP